MRWDKLLHRRRRELDLDEELRAHLDHEIASRVARGETKVEAERNARLAMGNSCAVAEETRASWSFAFLGGLRQDLTFAIRLMRRSPVFTLAAVASLALGIGANTAIYSVFDRVLLGSLPVERPGEIYQVGYRTLRTVNDRASYSFAYPFIKEIAQPVSCASGASSSLRTGDVSRIVPMELVCGNLFSFLGLKPHLGRLLMADDNLTPGAHPVVVLAYHFWQSEFGGDPAVIGRTVNLSRSPFTIVGVAPTSFHSVRKGSVPAMWAPIVMDGVLNGNGPIESSTVERGSWWLRLLVRKEAGVSKEQVEAELTSKLKSYRQGTLERALTEYEKKVEASIRISLDPAATGLDAVNQKRVYQKPLTMLFAVVGAVLLIACINIANLLLARASARQKEIATRLAIGASRARLVRQFLTESLALSLAGGLFGVILAVFLERILMREAFGVASLATLGNSPSFNMLAVSLAVSIFSGLAFGTMPALGADRRGVRAPHRMMGRKLMVSLQVSLSILLLTGAGLFLKTLHNLRSIDTGFPRENLITMRVTPSHSGRKDETALAYYRQAEERLKVLPGVSGASFIAQGLLDDSQWSSGIQVEGVEIPENEESPARNVVGSGFFTLIGGKLIAGRDFTERDNRPDAPKVALINESFARRYFGVKSPLGKRVGPGTPKTPEFEIVGVVRDMRESQIHLTAMKYWYIPYAQQKRLGPMSLTVRATGNPVQTMAAVKREVSKIDPFVPISGEQTLEAALESQIRQERLIALLSTFFAGVAVLLAVIGLYGVMAYTVERRTKEIGIRMALGESRIEILGRVMKEASVYIGVGVLAGVPLSLGLGAYAEKLLYGVKAADIGSILVAVGIIAGFGSLAGFLTARRAAAIDPMIALRIE